MSTAENVFAALEAVTGDATIRADRDLALFEHYVLDSLRTIRLVAELRARCGATIALTDIDRDQWATPRKVIAFMEARVGE